MARKIQHKRGLEKNLPTLAPGEFALTTDTKKVFVGTDNGNIEVTNKEAVENVAAQLAETVKEVNGVKPTNGKITLPIPEVDTSNLRTKSEKIKPEDLSEDTLSAMTGETELNLLTVPQDGSVSGSKYADGSFTSLKSATSLGSMQDYVYISNPDYTIAKSGTDIKVKFATGTNFIYRNIEGLKSVTISTLEYTIPQNKVLVLNLDTSNDLVVKDIGSVSIKDKVLLASVYGRPVINNMHKSQGDFNTMIFTQSTMSYTLTSGTINVTFAGDKRLFLRGGLTTGRQLSIPQENYSVPSGSVLSWSIYDNVISVKTWNSLLIDDIVLFGNHLGRVVQDNIGLKSANDTQKIPQSSDDLIYYGSTVTYRPNTSSAGSIDILFSQEGDKRLFIKKSNYNAVYSLAQFQFTLDNHQSLVYNKESIKLEVVNSDAVSHGKQLVLFANHNNMIKVANMRVENHVPDLDSYTVNSNEKREIKWNVEAHQGMTIIDDYLLVFNESLDDHSNWGNLYLLDKNTFELVKTIKHNLGHVNSCDYDSRTDKMIIGNNTGSGVNLPAALYVFNNAKTTFTQAEQIDFNSVDKLVIKLYTPDKELGNHGTANKPNACWGEESNIVYIVMNHNKNIYRCFLGRGANNLTTSGFGVSSFGDFITGKSDNEFNGTIKVLGSYPVDNSWGVNQGIAYNNGKILTATTHAQILTLEYELKSNGKAKLTGSYNHELFDGMGNRLSFEPEDIVVSDGKLYQSFRSGANGNGIVITPINQ